MTTSKESTVQVLSDCMEHLGGATDAKPTGGGCVVRELDDAPHRLPAEPHLAPTWDQYMAVLKNQPRAKSAGRDGINAYTLLRCPKPIIQFHHAVCTYFWGKTMPKDMCTANLTFLYKKGDVHKAENYRPIALLPLTYKMTASHITTALHRYTDEHKILHHSQHGGRHYTARMTTSATSWRVWTASPTHTTHITT